MAKVTVAVPGEKPYEVVIESDLLSSVGESLRGIDSNPRALVITDEVVGNLYLASVKSSLEKEGYLVSVITVPTGEQSKSLACAGEIWHAMVDCKLNRDSLVVALGGGVVGDLAGFTGSTFIRGLRIVQIPTTLLSMVDSSVGGKTAINLETGKNLVGTFCQPVAVYADLDTLVSLPEREWACGCAEIVKSAVIDSDAFFFWMVEHAQALWDRDLKVVKEAVHKSVSFKASVVVRDQQETKNIRECLNYGHTLAHAIEAEAGFGTYSHGHAVAQGMRFAARLGAAYLGTSLEFIAAQDALLDKLHLSELSFKASPEKLLSLMLGDKKVRSNKLRFVLPKDVGQWQLCELEQEFVLEHLNAWQKSQV